MTILLHFIEITLHQAYIASCRKQCANLVSRPYPLKQEHFRNSDGSAMMSNCRIVEPGTRQPNDTLGAELSARMDTLPAVTGAARVCRRQCRKTTARSARALLPRQGQADYQSAAGWQLPRKKSARPTKVFHEVSRAERPSQQAGRPIAHGAADLSAIENSYAAERE
jgi:hypothetical protein